MVDDEDNLRWLLGRAFEREGWAVSGAREPGALFDALERGVDLVLLDVRLGVHDGLALLSTIRERAPEVPVIVMTAYGTMETAIEAMQRGAFDYLVKPLDLDEVVAVARRALGSATRAAAGPTGPVPEPLEAVVGRGPRMQETFKTIGRIAASDATVVIQGESGTGKEVVARAIHRHSARAHGPFVPVDCAAIPANLLESELFGHEKGAFTGAFSRRRGRFELAEGGSVFLDEVGEMPLDLQAKLLRVLQERTVQRLGGVEAIPVDVRVIAATNRDLRRMVREGRFRDDLYYRLSVLSLTLPPLRERAEDIPALVEHFLRKYEPKLGRRRLAPEALECLLRYSWPGNVRELENVIHRAMVLVPAEVMGVEALPPELVEETGRLPGGASLERLVEQQVRGFVAASRDAGPRGLYATVLRMVERPLLRIALQETGGNQLRAARLLGINRNTLRKRVRALGLAPSPEDEEAGG